MKRKETFNELLSRLGIPEKIICPDCGSSIEISQDIIPDEIYRGDGDYELSTTMILLYECSCGYEKEAYSTTKGSGILR